jgi:NodT family efflux transporter outer membrane factor (OMF) lipoprotein
MQAPALVAPAQWRTPAGVASSAIHQDWWRAFGSDELNTLVALAQEQSLDLAAAIARVRQAEATARVAGAALLPALNGSLDASRQGRIGGNADVNGTLLSAGLSASYEVDFWGGNRATAAAAQASLQASAFDRDTVRLTVTAGVAKAWLQAVALRERIAIGQRNLESAQRLLTLVTSRAHAGSATQLELAQQRGLVASQQRVVASLRQQEADARTVIALLLGQTTSPALAAQTLAPLQVRSIGPGLPSELLAGRPDIARAEAQLSAANADIQVARAAMLPRLTLSSTVGGSGERLSRVLDNPIYSLAASLVAPIFNGGRLVGQRDLALARQAELLVSYRAAIVAAFGDVETSLNAVAGLDAQNVAQIEELAQAQRALTLAESRYRAGAETLLVLLDAQRTLYAAQDAAVQLKALRLRAVVDLNKALGGGWRGGAVAAG